MTRRGFLFIMPILLVAWFFVFGQAARAMVVIYFTTVSGQVRSGGVGVADATVNVFQNQSPQGEAITDQNGYYSLEVLTWGDDYYDFQILADGYQEKTIANVAIPFNSQLTLNFDLEPLATELEPVIIVPGIMGSYLYSYIDPGVEVWPAVAKTVLDPWDTHLNQLIMDEQGNPLSNTMIVPPQDIIRSVLNKDFFEGLINELKQNGYKENEMVTKLVC